MTQQSLRQNLLILKEEFYILSFFCVMIDRLLCLYLQEKCVFAARFKTLCKQNVWFRGFGSQTIKTKCKIIHCWDIKCSRRKQSDVFTVRTSLVHYLQSQSSPQASEFVHTKVTRIWTSLRSSVSVPRSERSSRPESNMALGSRTHLKPPPQQAVLASLLP